MGCNPSADPNVGHFGSVFNDTIMRTNFDFKYVIIGAGNSAGYAARELVKSRRLMRGELCIIGTEPVLPYERPALSKKFLMGKTDLPTFNTCAAFKESNRQDWYDKHGIILMTNTTVTSINTELRLLRTNDGKEIKYQKCLAATGARPTYLKVPGAALTGIHYLRTYAQANNLLTQLRTAKTSDQVVVLGAGFIETEIATAVLHHNVRHVTIVFPEACIGTGQLPPQIASVYEDALVSRGVKLIRNENVTEFGDVQGMIRSVCLSHGQKLPADLVIVGGETRPNTDIFQGKVALDKGGIKVDGKMRSSVDGLFACGDVASFPVRCYRERCRLEHVRAARVTAMQAARSMLDVEQKDIDFVPVYYWRIFDFSCEIYGRATEHVHCFGIEPEVGSHFGCVWVTSSGEVSGVLIDGASLEAKKKISRLVRQKKVLCPELLEADQSAALLVYILS